jgi:hypothetical protein
MGAGCIDGIGVTGVVGAGNDFSFSNATQS